MSGFVLLLTLGLWGVTDRGRERLIETRGGRPGTHVLPDKVVLLLRLDPLPSRDLASIGGISVSKGL